MANTRVLFVPWRQIESVEHYASRRNIPTTEDNFGRIIFDRNNLRNPTPWRIMLEPLAEYEVVNPTMTKNKAGTKEAEGQNRIQMAAVDCDYPGQEYKSKNRQWQKAKEGKNEQDWFQVWYNGRISPIIFSLRTSDEQIYIRGHGQPGDSGIYSGRFSWRLGAEEVAKRLIESGLQDSFAGKIKCYNCHSAEQGADEPFAQAFADYLYSKGYKSCEFFGYFGALDSFPGANENLSEKNKNRVSHKTSLYEDSLYRASAQRKRITPKKL